MDKLSKILFVLLISIIVLFVVLATFIKEKGIKIVYLEKHKYLIYTTSKNDCLIHSQECEICKNNHQ